MSPQEYITKARKKLVSVVQFCMYFFDLIDNVIKIPVSVMVIYSENIWKGELFISSLKLNSWRNGS